MKSGLNSFINTHDTTFPYYLHIIFIKSLHISLNGWHRQHRGTPRLGDLHERISRFFARGGVGVVPPRRVPPLHPVLRIENKIKPGIFDEKGGIAALLIKNSGFYFVRDPKPNDYSYTC